MALAEASNVGRAGSAVAGTAVVVVAAGLPIEPAARLAVPVATRGVHAPERAAAILAPWYRYLEERVT